MTEGKEGYQPSDQELRKADDMMTQEYEWLSKNRSEKWRWSQIKDSIAGREHGEEGEYSDTDQVVDNYRDFSSAIDSYKKADDYLSLKKSRYDKINSGHFGKDEEEKKFCEEYESKYRERATCGLVIDDEAFKYGLGNIVSNNFMGQNSQIDQAPNDILKYRLLEGLAMKKRISLDIAKYFPELEGAKESWEIMKKLPGKIPEEISVFLKEIDNDTVGNWWWAIKGGNARGTLYGWDSDVKAVAQFLEDGTTPFGNKTEDQKNYFIHLSKNYQVGSYSTKN